MSKGSRFLETSQPGMEAEAARGECGVELFEEQPAEQVGQDTHRQEEPGSAGDPALPVESDPSTGIRNSLSFVS